MSLYNAVRFQILLRTDTLIQLKYNHDEKGVVYGSTEFILIMENGKIIDLIKLNQDRTVKEFLDRHKKLVMARFTLFLKSLDEEGDVDVE